MGTYTITISDGGDITINRDGEEWRSFTNIVKIRNDLILYKLPHPSLIESLEQDLPVKVVNHLHTIIREFRAGVGVYSDHVVSAYYTINECSPWTETHTVVVDSNESQERCNQNCFSKDDIKNMYVPNSLYRE